MFLSIIRPGLAAEFPDGAPSQILLPPFQLDRRPARAHTQGLEITEGQFFITARRDDPLPTSALLLRTSSTRTRWDSWALTPDDPELNHPGGFQFDGRRLWVPIASSRRGGRTRIRAYPIAALKPGQPARPDREFTVADHIGALAVSHSRDELLGANWDTELIYVWTFDGRLKRRIETAASSLSGFGRSPGDGLAVQDWKIHKRYLFASGLVPDLRNRPETTASRLLIMAFPLHDGHSARFVSIPSLEGTELSREGMAIANGAAWFLPRDLGLTNVLYRIPLPNDLQRLTPVHRIAQP